MKIIIVTEIFYPSINGVVTRIVEAIRYLKQAGHDVTVLTSTGQTRVFEGAEVIALGRHRFPMLGQLRWLSVASALRRLIYEQEPDVIHIVNASLFGACGALTARQLGIPLVMSHHFDAAAWFRTHRFCGSGCRQLYWKLAKRCHNCADINLAISLAQRERLRAKGFDRVACIKPGVSTTTFHPRHADAEMRQRLSGGHPDNLLLLFVGKLDKDKEIDRLKALLQRAPDLHLALVGNGPMRKKLRRHFPADQVVFTGRLTGDALAAAYASCDVLVYPAEKNDLALVVLEGMASGLPVLAQDTPAMRLQLEDGKTGYLVSFTSTDDLMDKINELRNPERLNAMSVAARHYSEQYSWTVSSQQLLDYYHLAIAHRRKQAFIR